MSDMSVLSLSYEESDVSVNISQSLLHIMAGIDGMKKLCHCHQQRVSVTYTCRYRPRCNTVSQNLRHTIFPTALVVQVEQSIGCVCVLAITVELKDL